MEWVNYQVPLSPEFFTINGTNTVPPLEQFQNDLGRIVDMLVLGDFLNPSSFEGSCIADISLQREDIAIEFSLFESFDSQNNGFAGVSGTDEVAIFSAGGAPDSHLCLGDDSVVDDAYWSASDQFLGDWSSLFGEEIHYRATSSSNDDDIFAMQSVLMVGGNITLVANLPTAASQYWRNTRVPLVPEHWSIWINGEATDQPSEEMFRQVLADVTQLYFTADYLVSQSSESTCIDSVGLTGTIAPRSAVVYEANFDSGDEGWTAGEGSEIQQHLIAGGIPGGHICAEDSNGSGFNQWRWIATPELLGQLNSSSNELVFYRTSTSGDEPESALLESAFGNIVYNEVFAPEDSWKATRVPLRRSDAWVFEGTTDAPSEIEFQQILDSLVSVQLVGDFADSSRSDSSCLDSVVLR